MIGKNLIVAAGNGIATGDVAEAIDFASDWVQKTSDLTGNADGKAFTFSFWLWLNDLNGAVLTNGNSRLVVQVVGGAIQIYGKNTGDSNVLNFTTGVIPQNTWVHILVSFDLALTSNRYVYINDVQQAITWTTYTNTNVDRASTGTWYVIGPGLDSRASNVFLDYTYRDLSVEANRRLFVTADLKPADGQAALNPILYLPMSDPTQPGLNQGTGGNFTLTGTVARSGRGPNQYNAPYSDLDGTADFLSRTTAPTGIADGKQFTISFAAQPDTTGENYIFAAATSTSNRFYVAGNTGKIQIAAWNASGTMIFLAETASAFYVANRNTVVTVSIDLSDASKRHFYVNGVAVSMVWAVYTNDTIQFNITSTPNYRVGSDVSTTRFNGRIGALWFNTSYIDLSVPANLAKFVSGTGIDAKPVDLGATGQLPTGTSPLIYLPMYGNNAGKNYGTGGDFTVNSGPYTGARGPNEFWGNKADFNGTTGYLSRTSALSGVSDGKTFSVSFWFSPDVSATNDYILSVGAVSNPGSAARLTIYRSSANKLVISAKTAANTYALEVTTASTGFTAGTSKYIQMSFDLTNSANRSIYIDGVADSATWTTYANADIDFTSDYWYFGNESNVVSNWYDGKLSEFYFTTEYIDFSQEANRLKFRDAFGNPVNLTQQIEDAAIPNPAIYMRFPPTSFGTNSGTGGNFTVNGTITDGGQL